jgi:hypothetical protein
MPLPDQTPRLPKWPFLVGDCALIGAAWLIADRAGRPMPAEAVIAVTLCAVIAAVVGAIPFIADYARRQDEALDERQRSLEALARTISSAADQISIAANGFNEIAELAQKNLRHAEQLPQKMHEKIAEFQARVAQTTDEEKEELERELAVLRGSESERLESTATKIARAAADWAKVETASQKHLASTKELLAEFQESLSQVDQKIERVESSLARLAAQGERAESLGVASPSKLASLPHRSANLPLDVPAPASQNHSQPGATDCGPTATDITVQPAETPSLSSSTQTLQPAPMEPPSTEEATVSSIELSAIPANAEMAKPERKREQKRASRAQATPEILPDKPSEPEAPDPRHTEPASPEPLTLEFSQESPDDDAPSSAVSADGATRLLVTAYIGIGNRLFIRGDGPGLSWEKGVPLQFVSIGKWRWETTEAAAPIHFKLFKNDEIETTGPAAPRLEPGRQVEITAAF